MLSNSVPFWSTLWPALVATIGGVVVGLPIALWVNRLALRQARRREEADRKKALARAASALRESITWNGEKATSLAADIQGGKISIQTPLEAERWEAVKSEFVRTAQDPKLQGQVAYFFDQVRRAAQTADRRFEFTLGVSSATANAAQVDAALKAQLLKDLVAIAHEAAVLDGVLKLLET